MALFPMAPPPLAPEHTAALEATIAMQSEQLRGQQALLDMAEQRRSQEVQHAATSALELAAAASRPALFGRSDAAPPPARRRQFQ